MGDIGYFACLGVSILCAIAVPIACKDCVTANTRSALIAAVAGVGSVLGFVCSLPFGGTREMPWLPYIAGAYFGGIALTALFYSAQRPSLEPSRDSST